MKAFLPYIALVEDFFKSNLKSQAPHGLYDPITYIMGLGGKRLRPALLMASGELFGAKKEDLIQAAAAIELFHNFTLVHDDIMDEAPLRRGEETIHQKWDLNTGILSGDAMLIKS